MRESADLQKLTREAIAKAQLPVVDILPELTAALSGHDESVVQAPPGAGKTTLVPLALLGEPWLAGRRILMLEPRRIAARGAAERMADLLNERVGETVGYRVRMDSRVSAATRIEVVTEGILVRMLQSDPSLESVGLVIFDEFHERNLDADLALALLLQGRGLFRNPKEGAEPLKLMIMSATLENERVARMLGSPDSPAPLVRSEGRQFPVKPIYGEPWQAGADWMPRVLTAVLQSLAQDQGSLLVFLPGQGEIRRLQQMLEDQLAGELNQGEGVIIAPLYGQLTLAQQRQAIAPAPAGKRKIVLATAIAESSLTIEGVRIVIDAGFSRAPKFDPRTGMTRLETRRLSQASSIQRMGRAGRVEPGICYRLWSEAQQAQLSSHTPPEMTQADLCNLALQLVRWGIDDPQELEWLDAPPDGAYSQALTLLQQLGAIEQSDAGCLQLTEQGERMSVLPVHPRIAHLLVSAAQYGMLDLACDLAVLLEASGLPANSGADIESLLTELRNGKGRWKSLLRERKRLQEMTARQLTSESSSQADQLSDLDEDTRVGLLIAMAYPDRIAMRRSEGSSDYLLANGRAAQLHSGDRLQSAEMLAVAHTGGQSGRPQDRIFLAAKLEPSLFDGPLAATIETRERVVWDEQKDRLSAELQTCCGALILSRKAMPSIPAALRQETILNYLRSKGLKVLPWTDALRQWQARINFLGSLDLADGQASEWPDLSDEALLETLADWLGPFLDSVQNGRDLAALDLQSALLTLLPWPLPKRLETEAPLRLQVPSGSKIAIDYQSSPPVLAVKLQEMFGCTETPRIANGRQPLMLHLLSPARRPLQVTQDLQHFWQNSYVDVKKDMKGRYPKHYWPDDPLNAEATARAKPRK